MDHDASRVVVCDALRGQGVDVQTTLSAGNSRLSDEDQLQYAHNEGRVLYSANRHDFARLHSEWMKAGREHAGMIVRARQRIDAGTEIQALLQVLKHHESVPMTNLLLYLENWAP